jgi:hypothetical protein
VDVWTVVRVVYALAVIAATLAALRFGLRAAGRSRLLASASEGRFVHVLETTALSHDSALVVVRIGDTYRVLAAGHAGVTAICEIPQEAATRVVGSHRSILRGMRPLSRVRALLRV